MCLMVDMGTMLGTGFLSTTLGLVMVGYTHPTSTTPFCLLLLYCLGSVRWCPGKYKDLVLLKIN